MKEGDWGGRYGSYSVLAPSSVSVLSRGLRPVVPIAWRGQAQGCQGDARGALVAFPGFLPLHTDHGVHEPLRRAFAGKSDLSTTSRSVVVGSVTVLINHINSTPFNERHLPLEWLDQEGAPSFRQKLGAQEHSLRLPRNQNERESTIRCWLRV
jgi:hypothetical protein